MDIDVLHLVVPQAETSDYPMISGHLTTQKVDISKEVMTTWTESITDQITLSKKLYEPEVNTFIKVDYPAHGINHFAKERNYQIMICGSRGENIGISDKLFGTVSGALSQNANCPVIYIPLDYPYESIDFVGYASDLAPSDPFELWRGLEIISPDVPLTRFYHISNTSSEQLDRKKEELEKYLYDHNDSLQIIFYDVESNNIDQSLLEMIENYDLDLFIMTKKKENFLEKMIHKSHTKAILRKINIPLLVLNEK